MAAALTMVLSGCTQPLSGPCGVVTTGDHACYHLVGILGQAFFPGGFDAAKRSEVDEVLESLGYPDNEVVRQDQQPNSVRVLAGPCGGDLGWSFAVIMKGRDEWLAGTPAAIEQMKESQGHAWWLNDRETFFAILGAYENETGETHHQSVRWLPVEAGGMSISC